MKKILMLILSTFLLFANASENFYYQEGKKIFLTPIQTTQKFQKTDSNQTKNINYYKTPKGYTVGISKELIVKLKEEKNIEDLADKYALVVKEQLAQNLYVIEVNSTEETLTISNELTLDNDVLYAQPNFIKKVQQR